MSVHLRNITAEQSVLGSALIRLGPTVDRAAELGLQAADFSEPVHQRLWAGLVDLHTNGDGVDAKLLTHIVGDFDLGGLSTREYVVELTRQATGTTAIAGHVRLIKEAADRRQLLGIATDIREAVDGPAPEDPVVIGREAQAALDALAAGRGLSGSFTSASIGDAAGAAIDELDATRAGRRSSAIPTGLRQLDGPLGGGWRPGQFVILAGRPGMGKSTAGLAFAMAAAQAGNGVLFVTLEMAAQELSERAMSALSFGDGTRPVPYASLRRPNRLLKDDVDRLKAARERLREAPLYIEAGAAVTVARVRERAMAAARRFDGRGTTLRLVVVDHLGLLRSTRNFNNRVAEVSEITAGLKGLARELSTPIVALSQLSRASEARDDKRPLLSDLRDSGSIEQDADVVIGVFRPSYHLSRLTCRTSDQDAELLASQNSIEIEILKNRAGPTDRIRAYCSIANNFIADGGTF